jgi:crossover junction endodeoxyribonuclease RuvC
MSIYIGLDPGKKGAMAIMGYSNTTGERYMMKIIPFDPQEYIKTLKQFNGATVCIEQVHSLPREGVKSVWSFGQTYGWLLGVLDAVGLSYQTVPPNLWKKDFSLLRTEKKQSIEVCKRLFPGIELKRTDRCRNDDDNMADAALICEYARRHM